MLTFYSQKNQNVYLSGDSGCKQNAKNYVMLAIGSDASMYRNIELHRNTGTQEGYWTKATRPIYPDLDCRCGVENTSFRVDEP